MTAALPVDHGSFRDPAGRVFDLGDRILRTVSEQGAGDYERLRRSDLLARLIGDRKLVAATEVDGAALGAAGHSSRYVLEHPRLPFIAYPYEWSFSLLKAAALFHLDLQCEAFDQGITLADASAYNVQFQGVAPIFIDYLSFRPYRDGEFWTGHRQFCEQFLNPLLLRALLGIPHNAWYRGTQEGIATEDLNRLLKWRHKLSWRVLSNVVFPARLQSGAAKRNTDDLKSVTESKLPAAGYRAMLSQLRGWIAGLRPADQAQSTWQDYTDNNSYSADDEREKQSFVQDFIAQRRPALLWDLGCNTGAYSALALDSGAERVIGFDFDQGALERAYARAAAQSLPFTPLFLDATNPSPDQGWNHRERKSLQARAGADALLALAFMHHLAIARNVPLEQVVGWLIALAPSGVLEFVDKSDPQVERMLALRDDIFRDYRKEAFLAAVSAHARIIRSQALPSGSRLLVHYERAD